MSDLQGEAGRGHQGGRSGRDSAGAGDFQASVARLERAVQEVVATARQQVSGRATSFLDETSRRLERELGRRGARRDSVDVEDWAPRRLTRDRQHGKIAGVCAGIARYYRVEPWVVRCIAVTGLLFFPSIVFPAYWIMYIVMERDPDRRDRRASVAARARGARDDGAPAPEPGPRRSPRHSLRNVQADLMQVELRLRRMETHVTSERFELQREFNRIDPQGR